MPSDFKWWMFWLDEFVRGHRYELVEHGWPNGRFHRCRRCGDIYPLPIARIPGA